MGNGPIDKRIDPKECPASALAFLGDAVYSALVRKHLLLTGETSAKALHARAISYVSAPAQYRISQFFPQMLTEEEYAIFKRGRNAETGHPPKHGTLQEYHAATGLETLFGYWELTGAKERMKQIFDQIINCVEGEL